MNYDFKAARNQIQELTLTYRSLNYRGMLDEQNSIFLLESINELEEEIAEAKEEMVTIGGLDQNNKQLAFQAMQMLFGEV